MLLFLLALNISNHLLIWKINTLKGIIINWIRGQEEHGNLIDSKCFLSHLCGISFLNGSDIPVLELLVFLMCVFIAPLSQAPSDLNYSSRVFTALFTDCLCTAKYIVPNFLTSVLKSLSKKSHTGEILSLYPSASFRPLPSQLTFPSGNLVAHQPGSPHVLSRRLIWQQSTGLGCHTSEETSHIKQPAMARAAVSLEQNWGSVGPRWAAACLSVIWDFCECPQA